MDGRSQPSPQPEPARPQPVIAVLVAVQGAGLAVVCGWLIARGIIDASRYRELAFSAGGLGLAAAAGLGWLSRGWWLARRWAVSPTVLLELLALPVGYDAWSAGHHVAVGLAVLVPAAAALLLALGPGGRAIMRLPRH